MFLLYFPFWSLAQTSVDAVLASYQKDKDLAHANYSFCIMEAQSGKVIKEYQSELAMIPASTLKIITTSAALGILGKSFTYKTHVYLGQKTDSITGAQKCGLLIKGSGDPSFNSSYFYHNDSLFFAPIIKSIQQQGVRQIESPIVLDVSLMDDQIPDHWIWSDIGNYFGAGANSLSYKDNKFSLFYDSGSPHTLATLASIAPAYFARNMVIQSTVTSAGTEDQALVFGDPDTYVRRVSGTIPANRSKYEVEAQMPQPPLFFAHELRSELTKHGIVMSDAKPVLRNTSFMLEKEKHRLIHTHVSPKLDKLAFYTNTKSNNHYAESLLKTIGAYQSGKQGSTEQGVLEVKHYWKARGVDVSGLHMVDGSGLSRANTVTTKLQATILSKLYRDSSLYAVFNASLPIAGKSGSMAQLGKGTFAEHNLRAKTGYINRVRGYCGYVKTRSGKELAFSVLFNHYDCSATEARLKIEKLLVALVEL